MLRGAHPCLALRRSWRTSAHACRVNSLPGEAEAGEYLKQTALRDFGPVPEVNEEHRPAMGWKLTVTPHDVPVPALLKYALTLIGLKAYVECSRFY